MLRRRGRYTQRGQGARDCRNAASFARYDCRVWRWLWSRRPWAPLASPLLLRRPRPSLLPRLPRPPRHLLRHLPLRRRGLARKRTAPARTDAFAGKRIANVRGLTQYYSDIGAYDDITPGDGETTTFTPAAPPPHCGLAVGAVANQGLVRDCFALMAAKDAPRGTGSLNWDYGRAIATWDGITVSGTPRALRDSKRRAENSRGRFRPPSANSPN